MAALTPKGHMDRAGGGSFVWIAALAAILVLGLAWLLHDEGRLTRGAEHSFALPSSRDLPATPEPDPLRVPSPRPRV